MSCTRAVKGKDFIEVYGKFGMIRGDYGITDFSPYSLKDEYGENIEFSFPELDEISKLQLALASLYEEVNSHS